MGTQPVGSLLDKSESISSRGVWAAETCPKSVRVGFPGGFRPLLVVAPDYESGVSEQPAVSSRGIWFAGKLFAGFVSPVRVLGHGTSRGPTRVSGDCCDFSIALP